MEPHGYILIAAAFVVVAADVMIRLRMTSARRERCVEDLLGMLESKDESSRARENSKVSSGTALANSLLKCFNHSFASRQIVAVLADAPRGMTEKELEWRFAELAGHTGKRAVPAGAIRKVVMNLMSADLVGLSGGKLRTTDLGLALHNVLSSQKSLNAQE